MFPEIDVISFILLHNDVLQGLPHSWQPYTARHACMPVPATTCTLLYEACILLHDLLCTLQDNTMSVASLHQHVQRRTGLPPARQCLVISEDRARRQGFSQTVWRAKTQMSSVRQDMRAAIINSINFVFLPEMFNRQGLALIASTLCSSV